MANDDTNSNVINILDGKNMSEEELDEILNSDEEFIVELTDEQVAEQYAKIKGVSLEEAYEAMSDNLVQSNSRAKRSLAPKSSCSWLATSTPITIPNRSYKPTLLVYLNVCRGGGAQYIDTNTKTLLQEFRANPISFQGTIVVELYNGHFYYTVNGNFYDSTSTTHTGTTGVTTIFSATYSVASTSNYYASLTILRTKRDVLGY
ncbi:MULTISPECIES: hypothetical protein [unclassified Lysinibacillus]|uniref:hypothetical protein n=1 Tax=unclassified Lysinibacillus TaxID=2636778 RepID=UPI0037F40809